MFLRQFIKSDAGYIGMIGSRKKIARFVNHSLKMAGQQKKNGNEFTRPSVWKSALKPYRKLQLVLQHN